MTKEEYQRNFSTGMDRRGAVMIVPDDVERVADHTPCFLCGQARGCRHRIAA